MRKIEAIFMLARVKISIPGKPRAKARHRAGQGNMFPDKQTEAEEAYIRGLARTAMQGTEPWIGPVRLVLEAVFEFPMSWPPRVKQTSELAHISKPDLDNIEKLVLDSLNGVVYLDDCQVCDVHKRKRYGEGERVDVVLEQIVTISDHPAMLRARKRVDEEVVNPRGRRKKARRAVKPAVKDTPIGKRIK